ncbi:MAG: translation initiation factor IF-2 subunit alpha [Candidatus Altiarchaeota archaeon]|nr:translation initiation factor IF-2 subunit alpha [Candidatus Altiarchaeota archaeon]
MAERDSERYPEEGELVIGTVDSIFKQGAFISLDEYGDKKGMLHLSEISPKWVRNIRDYVKEGQKVVLLVLKVNLDRGHIDLSLRRVTDAQRKEKLQEIKQKQRSVKLLEQLSKELKLSEEDVASIKEKILKNYDSLYAGLETIVADNSEMDKLDIEKGWKPHFLDLINSSIKAPLVNVTGYVCFRSYMGDGVGDIKESLVKIRDYDRDHNIEVSYISAPVYRINVTAEDYKTAEKILKNSTEEGIKYLEEHNGIGEFHRKLAEKPEK